jgi:hypothetical protein
MEEGTRKQNFVAKLRVIEKNNQENKKWQMGQTKFTDLVSLKSFIFHDLIKSFSRSHPDI